MVYKDHLPLLGQHHHDSVERNELMKRGTFPTSPIELQYQQLEIGDRVRNLSNTSSTSFILRFEVPEALE